MEYLIYLLVAVFLAFLVAMALTLIEVFGVRCNRRSWRRADPEWPMAVHLVSVAVEFGAAELGLPFSRSVGEILKAQPWIAERTTLPKDCSRANPPVLIYFGDRVVVIPATVFGEVEEDLLGRSVPSLTPDERKVARFRKVAELLGSL